LEPVAAQQDPSEGFTETDRGNPKGLRQPSATFSARTDVTRTAARHTNVLAKAIRARQFED